MGFIIGSITSAGPISINKIGICPLDVIKNKIEIVLTQIRTDEVKDTDDKINGACINETATDEGQRERLI